MSGADENSKSERERSRIGCTSSHETPLRRTRKSSKKTKLVILAVIILLLLLAIVIVIEVGYSASTAGLTNGAGAVGGVGNNRISFIDGEFVHDFNPSRPLHSYNFCGSDEKLIALTFDDGPSPGNTERVLEVLDELDVPATFFLAPAANGEPTSEQCLLVREIRARNHSVQSHGWSHSDFLMYQSQDQIEEDLQMTKLWIQKCAEEDGIVTQFRPPHGSLDGARARFVSQLGYTIASWTVDSLDYLGGNATQVYKTTMDTFNKINPPSATLLMHDRMFDYSGRAIEIIVHTLRARGYRFVTVDECFAACDKGNTGGGFPRVCSYPGIWPGIFAS